ncbi:hypothetical protein ACFL1G_05035 [Planctomycetota bacterium]
MDEAGKEQRKNLIRFQCGHCGRRIHVSAAHSGKKGKCPKCGQLVTVPEVPSPAPVEKPPSPTTSGLDSLAFDVPPKQQPTIQPSQQSQAQQEDIDPYQMLRQTVLHKETKPPPERKLPWIIDIFLYPTNKSGLSMLGIIIGIPLLYGLFAALMGFLGLFNQLFLILFILLRIVGFIIGTIFGMYVFWYLCQCIRDSASGAIRAPETISITPGLGELFSQFIKVIGTLVFFTSPAIVYYLWTHQYNTIFWSLLSAGLLLYPMALLSVIMFDSFYGLNPVLVIGSVLSTFFAYVGLLLFLASFFILTKFLVPLLMMLSELGNIFMIIATILLYSTGIMDFYVMMVAAHLLGRFYFRYQEKLNWEV